MPYGIAPGSPSLTDSGVPIHVVGPSCPVAWAPVISGHSPLTSSHSHHPASQRPKGRPWKGGAPLPVCFCCPSLWQKPGGALFIRAVVVPNCMYRSGCLFRDTSCLVTPLSHLWKPRTQLCGAPALLMGIPHQPRSVPSGNAWASVVCLLQQTSTWVSSLSWGWWQLPDVLTSQIP